MKLIENVIFMEKHYGNVMIEPIFLTTPKGDKIKVLSPFEYDIIDSCIDKPYLRTIYHVAFFSGMRYIEVQRLYENSHLWQKERRIIHIPKELDRKVKRVSPERYITPIPPQLEVELPYFFINRKPPCLKVWDEDLKRWAKVAGMNTLGITSKMTRASIESWMVVSRLFDSNVIRLRQGHTENTAIRHYLALPFTEAEKIEIKRRLAGWK